MKLKNKVVIENFQCAFFYLRTAGVEETRMSLIQQCSSRAFWNEHVSLTIVVIIKIKNTRLSLTFFLKEFKKESQLGLSARQHINVKYLGRRHMSLSKFFKNAFGIL